MALLQVLVLPALVLVFKVIRTNDAIKKVLTGIGFGCAHKNTGNFIEVTAGLGEGPSRYPSNLRLQVLVLPSAS
ncbi:hypothetical protein AMTR_s00145p00070620 [Amborella trichopoda]|uniref:Uncharacterized protein n=1 Tax=Amborella trichopoda TaxID=13333 RepID=W1PE97_AMBTC|nr:hypothetical protein AMTR_s00145p00070620 [Amborella trichopoda]